MARPRFGNSIAVAACLVSMAAAQDQAETCYGPGSVVGAVIGTLIVTSGLLAFGFFLYKMYLKSRKGKHLVLMADAENPHDQYAFDNPCFREATPIKHNIQDEKQSSKLEKSKWPGWPPLHTFGKEPKSEKITSMDDSYINDSRLKVVTLKSHDFTGLGFNIYGNMRDGIFVKDVLHRGPAFESGCINSGDRIDSVCISFRNMVFEDALTILSYASPYDVQVQVENDSYSRPSTLIRSKRESTVNFADRILHPKYNRSQSISHLNEIGKSNNKKVPHQIGFMLEKNRINQSLNKSQELNTSNDYPTIKVSSPGKDTRKVNESPIPKILPTNVKKSPKPDREFESPTKTSDPSNKLQKFGIKVLPISINPKMGVQSMTGVKKPTKSPTTIDNEINAAREKPEKPPKPNSRSTSPVDDEADGGKDVKGMLAKGLANLKEKINQNSLGRKKKEHMEVCEKQEEECECPVPKLRSSVTCGVQVYEKNQIVVPEEVSRAGDVARNNRKSVAEKKSEVELDTGSKESESEGSDSESKDGTKRHKRSKGKAPAPPKQPKEIDEIKKESELKDDLFEPNSKTIPLKDEETNHHPSYDSDSDIETVSTPKDSPNTKIELNATQVTVHQPSCDGDDDLEPNRKAASLGDLSKLDSDQPLSVVLERAVSLDLTDGSSQCGKKRKAPLPPSEEFPAFDDYRKEPRLENSLGLNTFQRRLKKSSDFGTLEDVLNDGPKSLEIEVKPLDLTETHTQNIQEFSSWLAECRRPKEDDSPKVSSTSLININSDCVDKESGGVSFCVNGTNYPENVTNSRTVVVISQPNSLEPAILETLALEEHQDAKNIEDSPPKLPSTPMPVMPTSTVSSPLSSNLTYITEIKVSTSEDSRTDHDPKESFSERIQKFDRKENHFDSKIPIRAMKSETGQKVLATIQSLAKESSPTKSPEVEYARRVASLFENQKDLHLKSGPKPSQDFSPTKKIPPVVPPRKMETTLSKSTVTVELPTTPSEERNIVTFSSFVRKNEDPGSRISFKIKEPGEMNGEEMVPVKTSATKIVFESKEKDEY